jgi:hypothetical protein
MKFAVRHVLKLAATACSAIMVSAAAPALGLPDHHALVTTIFLGHPVHQPTRLKRNPVESFATVNRFDGRAFPS